MLINNITSLIRKEIMLELRQKYVINGILLYLISTIFVTFLAFDDRVNMETWNSLFWIILLFVSVNGISKSFMQENPARHIYYYTIASPQAIILAKIIYNLLLMVILSSLSLLFFVLMMGNRIADYPLFIVCLILGSLGMTSVLTMVSAIASRASNNFSLMAILSFPIILPLLSTLMKISKNALSGSESSGNAGFIILLLTINGAVIILAYLLFPYLWRD
jgi:heme exporter protein B